MDYHTLTESDFFRFVSQNTEAADIRAAYDEFSQTIFRSYVEAGNPHRLLFALIYAEVELQSLHDTLSDGKDGAAAYLKKALALGAAYAGKPANPSAATIRRTKIRHSTSAFPLDGQPCRADRSHLCPRRDGLYQRRQNDIKELTAFFGSQLGLEIKDSHCYNAYTDMKRRKSESRTYFLDKMRERLNLRMQRDDAKERARR